MSHTNTTPNYSLPQFVGTDKPAWLTDINQAFSNVDTAIKSAKDTADTATGSATTANNSIGTLSDLNTTNKSTLVGAINENNTNIRTVSGVASQAGSDATNAKNNITALESYLTLTNFASVESSAITYNDCVANGTPTLFTASNADGTVGKIYGKISLNSNVSGGTARATFQSPFRPSKDITITGAGVLIRRATMTNLQNTILPNLFMPATITVSTSGLVTISTQDNNPSWYNTYVDFILTASLLFFKDFGDTPITPEN